MNEKLKGGRILYTDNKYVSKKSIGVFTLLGLLFIALKLTHVIDWSWWYVTMPLWIPMAFSLIVLIIVFIIMLLV